MGVIEGVWQLSTTHAYVRTPQEVAFGFYSPNVNRDICLTEVPVVDDGMFEIWLCDQGLAASFERLRGNPSGFAPWAYFGASETGVFVYVPFQKIVMSIGISRLWPGQPRGIGADNECRPYDPVRQCPCVSISQVWCRDFGRGGDILLGKIGM